MLTRRDLLLAAGAAPLVLATLSQARSEDALTVLIPHPGGAFEAIMQAVSEPLSQALGRDVAIKAATGDGGWVGVDQVVQDETGSVVIVSSTMNLVMKQYSGGREFSLALLSPVAQFGSGYGVTLFARQGADYASWSALKDAAGQRTFTMAGAGPQSSFAVAEKMLGKVLDASFTEVQRIGPQAIFDAVVNGEAELGIITDPLITTFNDASSSDGVVPIVSFGTERSAAHPDTPTLAEISGDEMLGFTIAAALFGSQYMTEATVEAIARGLADATSTAAFASTGYPTEIEPSASVRERYERELALLEALDTP
ncbi:hypothetical protein [Bauldia sp.]|uniref:hypothetical protein n=1 Tax=Bauldia sp. TaxID=2575872 RepID=UPI003BAA033D